MDRANRQQQQQQPWQSGLTLIHSLTDADAAAAAVGLIALKPSHFPLLFPCLAWLRLIGRSEKGKRERENRVAQPAEDKHVSL